MTDHKLRIDDGVNMQDDTGGSPDRKTYEVTAEAGLFKNGRQYDKGTEVELEVTAAARFLERGEVKELKDV